ncbi:50S ribosomal protein L10 [Parapedobacter pyrenivorans]|uniref:Large ribosomal subunit protein uL10 n=1 Tax=Parapedobacter pyrenivorans TaxID=1305674 RepID=A0A917HKP3_9SPHI|nr:50S ribosomal protein L10 [Parapedobacter pyrenivorans]GGG82538.1 50S ribosomal protein L10 [Parapedobacter pyrenivorans]
MKREEKQEIVKALAEQIKSYGNFYITDTADLTVAKINGIRRKCFDRGIAIQVVKNTLIQKALVEAGVDSEDLLGILKGSSTMLFSETGNAPAKLIKELRKEGDKPVLKGAYIDAAVFIGDNQVDTLSKLKSKNELIGDIIGLLQSPAKNVVSALQSGGNTLAGLVKTLQERG